MNLPNKLTMMRVIMVPFFMVFAALSHMGTPQRCIRDRGQVEATANRIAHGDLTTRLPDAPYDDEIGRLCKDINQMAEDMTKTERMKNEFISSVSHELRTPPVSYTHLDVYKRQCWSSIWQTDGVTEEYLAGHGRADAYKAVSYTHLDVYKRQLLHRAYQYPTCCFTLLYTHLPRYASG